MRIFLWGMMGSGKSELGKFLYQNLKKFSLFIDLDIEIEKITNKTIKELFTSKGEEFFRFIENQTLQKIINNHSNFIMATGGGTPVFFDNHQLMYKTGLTIYLKAPVDLLIERLWKERNTRPLISHFSKKIELQKYLEKLLAQREAYYHLAHIYWEIDRSKEELLEKIKIMLGSNS